MFTYPKKVMSIAELVENCKAAQLTITSDEEAAELFMKIGFYPNRRKTPSFSYGDIRRVSFAGSMPVKDTIQRR